MVGTCCRASEKSVWMPAPSIKPPPNRFFRSENMPALYNYRNPMSRGNLLGITRFRVRHPELVEGSLSLPGNTPVLWSQASACVCPLALSVSGPSTGLPNNPACKYPAACAMASRGSAIGWRTMKNCSERSVPSTHKECEKRTGPLSGIGF